MFGPKMASIDGPEVAQKIEKCATLVVLLWGLGNFGAGLGIILVFYDSWAHDVSAGKIARQWRH